MIQFRHLFFEEVLEKQEPAVFRQKLFNILPHYYKEIQSMSCAG